MEPLTDRQSEVLRFICEFRRKNGFMPRIAEMMQGLGILSPNGIVCHLRAIERKGYIKRTPLACRAIEVIHEPLPPRDRELGVPASVVGETINRHGFGEALAEVLRGVQLIS